MSDAAHRATLRAHDLHRCACGQALVSKRFHHCSQGCRMQAQRRRQAARRASQGRPVNHVTPRGRPPAWEDAQRIEATIAKWEAHYRRAGTYRVANGWDGYTSPLGDVR